jgi:Na+/phosphate symporter
MQHNHLINYRHLRGYIKREKERERERLRKEMSEYRLVNRKSDRSKISVRRKARYENQNLSISRIYLDLVYGIACNYT